MDIEFIKAIEKERRQFIDFITNIKYTYPVERLRKDIKEIYDKAGKPLFKCTIEKNIIYDNLDEWNDFVKPDNFVLRVISNGALEIKKGCADYMIEEYDINQYIKMIIEFYQELTECIETRIDAEVYLKVKDLTSSHTNFYNEVFVQYCPIYGIVHFNINKCINLMKMKRSNNNTYSKFSTFYTFGRITYITQILQEWGNIIDSQKKNEIVEVSIRCDRKQIDFKYYPSKDFDSYSRSMLNTNIRHSKITAVVDNVLQTADCEFIKPENPRKIYIDLNYCPYEHGPCAFQLTPM